MLLKGLPQSLKDRVEKLDEVYDGIHLDIETPCPEQLEREQDTTLGQPW